MRRGVGRNACVLFTQAKVKRLLDTRCDFSFDQLTTGNAGEKGRYEEVDGMPA